MRKKLVSALLALALVLGMVVLPAGAASTAQVKTDNYYALYNAATGKVLNVYYNRSADGTNVDIYDMDYTDSVYWKFTASGSNYVLSPRNAKGSALNVYGYSAKNGSNVCIWTKSGHSTQSWVVEAVSGGFILRSADNTSVVLTATGTKNNSNVNLQTYQAGNRYQIWTSDAISVTETATQTQTQTQTPTSVNVADGWYTLTPKCAPDARLDLNGIGSTDGTNIQIWTYNGTNAQRFYVKSIGGGYYTIGTCHDGMLVDVNGGSTAKGTNVQQYHAIVSDAQKWTFQDAGDGYVWIVPFVSSSLRLDVNGASSASGTNVQVWTSNNSDAQKWKLKFTRAPETTAAKQDKTSENTNTPGLIWPLANGAGSVSSAAGVSRSGYIHVGTDIAAPAGTPILAVADGTVATAQYNSARGYYIKIDHGDYYCTYQHMQSAATVTSGSVRQGQVIGYVGSTGESSGNHLHFEIVLTSSCPAGNKDLYTIVNILKKTPVYYSVTRGAKTGNYYALNLTQVGGSSASAAAQSTTETGTWIMYVPAGHYLPLYSSATSTALASSVYARSESYRFKCTQKYTANGKTRYRATFNDHGTPRDFWLECTGGMYVTKL